MPTHRIRSIVILSAWLSAWALSSGAQADETKEKFHTATTPAEKALNAAIRRSDADQDMIFFIVRGPRDREKDGKYAGMFTAGLQKAWAREEAEAVQEQCGGVYKNGEICGLDFNPFTCMQDDFEDGYDYRTEASSNNVAIVSYRWIKGDGPIATYRMIRINGSWLVDGVRCSNGHSFNMK